MAPKARAAKGENSRHTPARSVSARASRKSSHATKDKQTKNSKKERHEDGSSDSDEAPTTDESEDEQPRRKRSRVLRKRDEDSFKQSTEDEDEVDELASDPPRRLTRSKARGGTASQPAGCDDNAMDVDCDSEVEIIEKPRVRKAHNDEDEDDNDDEDEDEDQTPRARPAKSQRVETDPIRTPDNRPNPRLAKPQVVVPHFASLRKPGTTNATPRASTSNVEDLARAISASGRGGFQRSPSKLASEATLLFKPSKYDNSEPPAELRLHGQTTTPSAPSQPAPLKPRKPSSGMYNASASWGDLDNDWGPSSPWPNHPEGGKKGPPPFECPHSHTRIPGPNEVVWIQIGNASAASYGRLEPIPEGQPESQYARFCSYHNTMKNQWEWIPSSYRPPRPTTLVSLYNLQRDDIWVPAKTKLNRVAPEGNPHRGGLLDDALKVPSTSRTTATTSDRNAKEVSGTQADVPKAHDNQPDEEDGVGGSKTGGRSKRHNKSPNASEEEGEGENENEPVPSSKLGLAMVASAPSKDDEPVQSSKVDKGKAKSGPLNKKYRAEANTIADSIFSLASRSGHSPTQIIASMNMFFTAERDLNSWGAYQIILSHDPDAPRGKETFTALATEKYHAEKDANAHRLDEWKEELCARALELKIAERPLNPAEDAIKNMQKVERRATALARQVSTLNNIKVITITLCREPTASQLASIVSSNTGLQAKIDSDDVWVAESLRNFIDLFSLDRGWVSWDEIRLEDAFAMAIAKKPQKGNAKATQASTSATSGGDGEDPLDEDDPLQPGTSKPRGLPDLLVLARLWAEVKNAGPKNPFYMPPNYALLDYTKRHDFGRKIVRMLLQVLLGAALNVSRIRNFYLQFLTILAENQLRLVNYPRRGGVLERDMGTSASLFGEVGLSDLEMFTCFNAFFQRKTSPDRPLPPALRYEPWTEKEKAFPVNSVEHLTIDLVRGRAMGGDKLGSMRASVIDAKLYMSKWGGDVSIKEKAEHKLQISSMSTALNQLQAPEPLPPAGYDDDLEGDDEALQRASGDLRAGGGSKPKKPLAAQVETTPKSTSRRVSKAVKPSTKPDNRTEGPATAPMTLHDNEQASMDTDMAVLPESPPAPRIIAPPPPVAESAPNVLSTASQGFPGQYQFPLQQPFGGPMLGGSFGGNAPMGQPGTNGTISFGNTFNGQTPGFNGFNTGGGSFNPSNMPFNPLNMPFNSSNMPFHPSNMPFNPMINSFNPSSMPFNPSTMPFSHGANPFAGGHFNGPMGFAGQSFGNTNGPFTAGFAMAGGSAPVNTAAGPWLQTPGGANTQSDNVSTLK
ncbi:hypothetical protein BKA70DRAFT_1442399 [Coprinopsis sp. MPI-PUGE-AT-0042]|nr:hypothetical protein BKA70DRAFT_1442399 [Coprinopsis sp. MPI-PUGE-AT-0042]